MAGAAPALATGLGATAGTGATLGAGALGGGLAAMGSASPAMLAAAPALGGAAMTAGKGAMAGMLAKNAASSMAPNLLSQAKTLLQSGKGKLAPYEKEIGLAQDLLFGEAAPTPSQRLSIPQFTPVKMGQVNPQLAYNLLDILRSSSR